LNAPIPWLDPELGKAGTVHIGGTLGDITRSEIATWDGKHPEKPFVLLAQQSQFDTTRAPQGKHTAWAYCHVPNGSQQDVSAYIENQVEQHAPGFKDCILNKTVQTAVQMEQYNPNYAGGDINSGVQNLRQQFTRPAIQWDPYHIPQKEHNTYHPKLFLCSSATPPGGGVHGMCGFYAAESVLRRIS